ncbi:hypothetical protein RI129_003929 [Pyrocoelia pectoralis]|uniref:Flavin-containing monooxygenase n=1 Tax=Pyrocoelia pectoralis TaxID=417401 RepID=A0AAN7ZPB9_9COLE
MKIAIIGAGVAGLVSLKYALASGHECVAFEQTGELGGTWVYSHEYAVDEFGFPTHRTMYKGLITNLPKEVMEYHDFPYPATVEKSFLTQPEVLQYLHNYSVQFNLNKHIQYYKRVTRVHPTGTQWTVTVFDVKSKVEESNVYDAVFVCNGHFFHPHIPKIEGQDLFKGLQIHSRDYRSPDKFKNKRVLIIGASFSGNDIAGHILSTTKKIIISHQSSNTVRSPSGVAVKPGVVKFNEYQASFDDGSVEDFDIILYCTGYEYFFPFLTDECGIKVEDKWVRNLYKHIVNVEKTTLFFIGVPFYICVFPMCDIQARFALATLEKKIVLPSKEEMLKEINEYVSDLRKKNIPQRHVHKIGLSLDEYLNDLAKMAGIQPVRPVIMKLYKHFIENKPNKVSKYVFIDDENYEQVLL